MGGEPTVAKELDEMVAFAKLELGSETRLGHTNGSRLAVRSTPEAFPTEPETPIAPQTTQ